eukprot:m.205122 g.205122  ORF g.205122 m.205122 type:complete len:544 (-) comp18481_c1_seq1:42-1673(-)
MAMNNAQPRQRLLRHTQLLPHSMPPSLPGGSFGRVAQSQQQRTRGHVEKPSVTGNKATHVVGRPSTAPTAAATRYLRRSAPAEVRGMGHPLLSTPTSMLRASKVATTKATKAQHPHWQARQQPQPQGHQQPWQTQQTQRFQQPRQQQQLQQYESQQQQQLLLQHQPHSSHRHQQPSVVETAGPRLRGSGPRPNQASTWTQLEPAQTALQQPPAEARRPALSSSLEPASRLFPGALSSVETGRTQQLPSHATGAAPRSPDHGYEFEGDLALALRVLGGDQAVRHVLSHRQPDQYMTKFGLDGQTLVDRVGAVLESSLPLLEKAYGSDMPRDSQQRAKWLAERWYGGLLLASDATGGRPHYLPDHLWDDPGPAQRHRQQLVGSRDVDVNRPWVQVVVCKLKNSPPTMSATNHVVKFPPLRRNTDPASRASRQVTHEVGVSLQLPADLSSHFLLLAINQHHQYIPILPSTDTLVCQQVGPFVRIVLRFHRHGDRVLQEFEVANLGVVPLKWSVRDALRPLDGWLGSPAVCFTSGAGGGGGGGGSQL